MATVVIIHEKNVLNIIEWKTNSIYWTKRNFLFV